MKTTYTEFEYGVNWRHWVVGVIWSDLYLTLQIGPLYFGWWFHRPISWKDDK